jgi:hypothetical protein
VVDIPACAAIGRFRSDFSRRYPKRSEIQSLRSDDQVGGGEPAPEAEPRLQKLPPEIGMLLIVVGTAGVLLPGPVGSPFLVAGGLALWPSAFRKVERWMMRVTPKMYDTGIRQIEHFLSDLERRYPGSVHETTSLG